MATRNERLLLDRPDIVIERRVEYQGVKILRRRKKKSAFLVTADRLLLFHAKHKAAGADSGLYDSSKEHMDVSDDVRVKSPQYSIVLKSASVDFNSGHYVSNEPVTIVTNSGTTLVGDTITVLDNGKELTVEGHVRTMIPPDSAADETQAQLKGANP